MDPKVKASVLVPNNKNMMNRTKYPYVGQGINSLIRGKINKYESSTEAGVREALNRFRTTMSKTMLGEVLSDQRTMDIINQSKSIEHLAELAINALASHANSSIKEEARSKAYDEHLVRQSNDIAEISKVQNLLSNQHNMFMQGQQAMSSGAAAQLAAVNPALTGSFQTQYPSINPYSIPAAQELYNQRQAMPGIVVNAQSPDSSPTSTPPATTPAGGKRNKKTKRSKKK